MKKILLTGAFDYSRRQMEELEGLGYEIIFVQDEREKLTIDPSDIEVVVCNGLFLYNDIREFKKLKLIQLTSAGFDRVPIDYIKENNIKIFNAKNVYSIPMAEWAILKILEIYKKSRMFYKNQEKKLWQKERDLLELTDKTVSILGFGNIGEEIAKRLKAFNAKIIGIDIREINSDYLDKYLHIKDIDEAFNQSDIIILTLPLTDKTKGIINQEKISKMKNDVVLVNLARGGLINESDLIQALDEDKFLGLALDVFQEEPISNESLLWDYSQLIITPHNSFVSDKVNERLFNMIAENLKMM